ncbi:carboxypeptidase-like regulatory domain-containing protein [Flavobacteriaceae bacterium MHTCC 0001]
MSYSKVQMKQSTKLIPLFLLLCIGISNNLQAVTCFQNETTIPAYNEYKGKVLDAKNKKPLALATLQIEGSNISTITNSEGNFSLKVPKESVYENVIISFLGYETTHIPLAKLKENDNRIELKSAITQLEEIDINVITDATKLVKEVFRKIEHNYIDNPTIMTAFYRETIKKRRKNVSLSEAIVNIHKSAYSSFRKDYLELFKSRKSTNYSRMDTLVLKLQGGPFNTLLMDVVKYPEYIFSSDKINHYYFKYDHATTINDKKVAVISFRQKENAKTPLYVGHLFIDAKHKVLISANYSLNITNKQEASEIFIRKKPSNAKVWPQKVNYRVDYREKNGKWYYSYSKAALEFKVNWANKLFNSTYSTVSEMVVTDWKTNKNGDKLKQVNKLKRSIVLTDKIIGFYDNEFWGKHNIIEPEKSIASAIKKIKKQLEKAKT